MSEDDKASGDGDFHEDLYRAISMSLWEGAVCIAWVGNMFRRNGGARREGGDDGRHSIVEILSRSEKGLALGGGNGSEANVEGGGCHRGNEVGGSRK